MTQPSARVQPAAQKTTPTSAADPRGPGLHRLGPSLAAATLLCVVACSEDVTPNPGGGSNGPPPVNQDPRHCYARGNDAWMNSKADVVTSTNTNTAGRTVINPCPFVVRTASSVLDLGIVSTIPKASTNLVGIPLGTVNIYDVYSRNPLATTYQGRFAANDAIDASRYRLELVTNNLVPGTYKNPAQPAQLYDSIDVLIDNTNLGQAHGYRLMPGNIDPNGVSTSGTTTVAPGIPAKISARTGYPSTAYVFQWSVDGTVVRTGPGSTLTYSWDAPGNHAIRVTAFRSDGTSETNTWGVTVAAGGCGTKIVC